MKYLKVVLITLVLAVGFSFPYCGKGGIDPCYCAEYYEITGMEVSFDKFKTKRIPTYNREKIKVDEKLLFSCWPTSRGYCYENCQSFSLINSALASDCIGPRWEGIKNQDSLERFSVITVNDFDEHHKAGDEISELLYDGINKMSLAEIYSLKHYHKYGSYLHRHVWLKLTKRPTLNKEFKVKVILELSTGEKYEVTSTSVVFAD